MAVDTCGLLLGILVTPASVQDRDGGRWLLWRLRRHFPTIRLVWADAGYAGKLVTWAAQVLTLTLAIVRKRQGVHHFEVLPRRWVVERTFSWLGKCRRLAVDYERKSEHHHAWVQWAMVRVMVKRLTRQAPHYPSRTLSLDTASAHKDRAPTRTMARTRRVLGSARTLTHPDHAIVQQANLAAVRSVPRALS